MAFAPTRPHRSKSWSNRSEGSSGASGSAQPGPHWWLAEVRHQCGPDWADPDAPLLPSERFDHDLERCGRVGANAMRRTLGLQVDRWLPAWSDQLTPHVLRHYCASSLYGAGMDIKALQELLGHQWLSTTSGYIHVRSEHVEMAWKNANQRVESRFTEDR